ncbi:hypothetical protein SKAU_G00262480 [Synaphobranchus kaupii]|uniref:Uncharacterized protein n=1 Tax=Synaphobranchus kaupii TaxID=118154 RepID=A0A9Q1EYX8_SYNKA|nr:hypothetical protein SKAU_G00262480 [Synaphobranchus kaupii]
MGRAAEKLGLMWPDCESRFDERFNQRNRTQQFQQPLPCFPEVPQKLRKSWKTHYSACVPVQAYQADLLKVNYAVLQIWL